MYSNSWKACVPTSAREVIAPVEESCASSQSHPCSYSAITFFTSPILPAATIAFACLAEPPLLVLSDHLLHLADSARCHHCLRLPRHGISGVVVRKHEGLTLLPKSASTES